MKTIKLNVWYYSSDVSLGDPCVEYIWEGIYKHYRTEWIYE